MTMKSGIASLNNCIVKNNNLYFKLISGTYISIYKFSIDEDGRLRNFCELPNLSYKIHCIVFALFGIAFAGATIYYGFDMKYFYEGLGFTVIFPLAVKLREFMAMKAMEELWQEKKEILLKNENKPKVTFKEIEND